MLKVFPENDFHLRLCHSQYTLMMFITHHKNIEIIYLINVYHMYLSLEQSQHNNFQTLTNIHLVCTIRCFINISIQMTMRKRLCAKEQRVLHYDRSI